MPNKYLKRPKDFITTPKTPPHSDLSKKQEGAFGEATAATYLKSKHFTIIERNARERFGEIDIVAIDGDTLVIVEVKTRVSHEFGEAVEAITAHKLKALKKSALYYHMTHPGLPERIRMDLVAVTLSNPTTVSSIEHIQNMYIEGLA